MFPSWKLWSHEALVVVAPGSAHNTARAPGRADDPCGGESHANLRNDDWSFRPRLHRLGHRLGRLLGRNDRRVRERQPERHARRRRRHDDHERRHHARSEHRRRPDGQGRSGAAARRRALDHGRRVLPGREGPRGHRRQGRRPREPQRPGGLEPSGPGSRLRLADQRLQGHERHRRAPPRRRHDAPPRREGHEDALDRVDRRGHQVHVQLRGPRRQPPAGRHLSGAAHGEGRRGTEGRERRALPARRRRAEPRRDDVGQAEDRRRAGEVHGRRLRPHARRQRRAARALQADVHGSLPGERGRGHRARTLDVREHDLGERQRLLAGAQRGDEPSQVGRRRQRTSTITARSRRRRRSARSAAAAA